MPVGMKHVQTGEDVEVQVDVDEEELEGESKTKDNLQNKRHNNLIVLLSRVSNSQTDRGRSARTYHQPLKAP